MSADSELLRRYTEENSQDAFAEFVQRHLPMVFSAALRRSGGDRQRAQDVAQQVFTLAANRVEKLRRHPAAGGWLYVSTCHVATKLGRAERRRAQRERAAQAQLHHEDDEAGQLDWARVAPLLDEVMLELRDMDRRALLWRYFEGRPHGEIGEALGLSANAVRMRQERALESLRVALQRRGIGSTVGALASALTVHAVTAPPAGLVALTAVGASAGAVGSGLSFLMNATVLKTVTVVAVVGAGVSGFVWQQREIAHLRTENESLRARHKTAVEPAARPVAPVAAQSDEAGAGAEVARLRTRVEELRQSPAATWQERADVLRELVQSLPDLEIPEMQLATPEDWLDAAKEPMESEDDYRRALGQLRNMVIGRFSGEVQKAVTRFMQAEGDRFPTRPAQLEPYLERSIGAEVWARYEIQPAEQSPIFKMGGDWIITQKAPIDATFDQRFVVGPFGVGSTAFRAELDQGEDDGAGLPRL